MIDKTKQKNKTPEELQSQIDIINSYISNQKKNPELVDHFHDGFDSSYIQYANIENKTLYINHTIYGTDAATATNYGVFYIEPVACVVISVMEVHQTAGDDAGAVTIGIEKLSGTEALGSGDSVLSTELSLKSTANTTQTGVLSSTLSNRSLIAGDRLALEDTGTLTSVANVTVKVELTVV